MKENAFVFGLLFGLVFGAAAAAVLAPQRGRQSRAALREQGLRLKDQVDDMLNNPPDSPSPL
jgi:gas vesicle protein